MENYSYKLIPTKELTNVYLYQENTSYDVPKLYYSKIRYRYLRGSGYKCQYFNLYSESGECIGTNDPNEKVYRILTDEEVEYWVNRFQEHLSDELIIEPQPIKVYINGIFKGYHNEYTCRNLQVQVKKGLLQDEVKLINSNEIEVTIGKDGKFVGNVNKFMEDTFDLTYKLCWELLD